jgi:hypothetical protein
VRTQCQSDAPFLSRNLLKDQQEHAIRSQEHTDRTTDILWHRESANGARVCSRDLNDFFASIEASHVPTQSRQWLQFRSRLRRIAYLRQESTTTPNVHDFQFFQRQALRIFWLNFIANVSEREQITGKKPVESRINTLRELGWFGAKFSFLLQRSTNQLKVLKT